MVPTKYDGNVYFFPYLLQYYIKSIKIILATASTQNIQETSMTNHIIYTKMYLY
jgi:hypothetical protein